MLTCSITFCCHGAGVEQVFLIVYEQESRSNGDRVDSVLCSQRDQYTCLVMSLGVMSDYLSGE